MKFTFEGVDYEYPAQLADITLGQRIAFHEAYGAELDKDAQGITGMADGPDKDLEHSLWYMRAAVESFSFFTGIDIERVKTEFALDQVLNVYSASLSLLFEQEAEIELQEEYVWNDEVWVLGPPVVTPTSAMTFNEFLISKESVRQLMQLGMGKWEALPYLCCVYLRKEDEEFTESLVDPDGERMKLMNTLPWDMALHVGFFLSNSLSLYQKISQSSDQERRETAQI